MAQLKKIGKCSENNAGKISGYCRNNRSFFQTKSKAVRTMLGMSQFNHNWSLPSRLHSNSTGWMVSLNGMIVDVRGMPREVQEVAFEKGLIPYIPDDRE